MNHCFDHSTNVSLNIHIPSLPTLDICNNDNEIVITDENNNCDKKRKSCEYPWSEFIFAVTLLQPTNYYNSYTDIYNAIINDSKYLIENGKLKLNSNTDLEKYEKDMKLEKETKIKDFIQTLYENQQNMIEFQQEIECIFISGKTNKHEEIKLLNQHFKNRKEVKSDIYIKFVNGEIFGISIKNDEKATKSNYSVHKILDVVENGSDKILSKYLKTYLNENGVQQTKKTDSKEEKKHKRTNANQLFYDKNNPYWNQLRTIISKYNNEIKHIIVAYLYSSTVHYPVYEYDGKKMILLNIRKDENIQIIFQEYEEYYKKKNGNNRNTSKMFYQLIVQEKKYRVEIRWKGDCFVSPQFEIHEE